MTAETSASALTAAVSRVMKDVRYVQKTGKSKQGYTYVTDLDLLQSVRSAMTEHGLVMIPVDMTMDRTTWKTQRGECILIYVLVTYELRHVSGESLLVKVWGTGWDNLDKAANKAMTTAYKYALRQTFMVPTGDDSEAADDRQAGNAIDPEEERRRQAWDEYKRQQEHDHQRQQQQWQQQDQQRQQQWSQWQQQQQQPPPAQPPHGFPPPDAPPPPGWEWAGPPATMPPPRDAAPPMPDPPHQPGPPAPAPAPSPPAPSPPAQPAPPEPVPQAPRPEPVSTPQPAPPAPAPAPYEPPPSPRRRASEEGWPQQPPPPASLPAPPPTPTQVRDTGAPPTPRQYHCGACNLTHLHPGHLGSCPNCGVVDELTLLPLAAARGPMPMGETSVPSTPPPPPVMASSMVDQWWFRSESASAVDRLFQGRDYACIHCGWSPEQMEAVTRDCGIDLDDPTGSTITDERVDTLFSIIQNPPQQ